MSLGPLLLGMSPDPVPQSATPHPCPVPGWGGVNAPHPTTGVTVHDPEPTAVTKAGGKLPLHWVTPESASFFFFPFLMENVSYISQFQVKPTVIDVLLQ